MDSAVSPSTSGSPEIDRKIQEAMREAIGPGVTDLKEVDAKEGVSDWVLVAQEKRSLKKYEVEVTTIDGKNKVVIPDNLLADATPLWEDFIVGKFLDISPHIAKVHMVVNKIWSYGDSTNKVEVYDVNATTMRFKIRNPKIREKVLRRGMWNIVGVPMIVKKWTPKTEEEKQEEETIPMWVHLRKVPLQMFSWEALSFMTSTVGSPVHLHPETIACSNFEEAKVFVNVDVSKTLPKEIDFTIGGKEFTAEFYYPWLPSRCSLCEKWGHSDKVCVLNKKDKKQGLRRKEEGSGTKERRKESVERSMIKEKEDQSKTTGSVVKELNKEIDVLIEKEDNEQKDKERDEWFQVAPDKVGRSQTTPQRQEEVQISASKYSVLCEEEKEEGEIRSAEMMEEEEGNNEEGEECNVTQEDLIEEELLDQKEKAVVQKGVKKVQKTRAQDANPKGKRSSRRKL